MWIYILICVLVILVVLGVLLTVAFRWTHPNKLASCESDNDCEPTSKCKASCAATTTTKTAGCVTKVSAVSLGHQKQARFLVTDSYAPPPPTLPTAASNSIPKAFQGPLPASILSTNTDQKRIGGSTENETKKQYIFVGVGINYISQPQNRLPTCWNDIELMYSWWNNRTQSQSNKHVFFVTDKPGSFSSYGNNNNNTKTCAPKLSEWYQTLEKVRQLCQTQHDQHGETELVLVYSGHGFYQRAKPSSEERDGRSECLVMLDGFSWDYELASRFTERLPSSCSTFAVFDSCHSGTVLNLKYSCASSSSSPVVECARSRVNAPIWMISGCQDAQTSSAGDGRNRYSILTDHWYKLVSQPASITKPIANVFDDLVRSLKQSREAQLPLLSASEQNLFQIPLSSS